MYGKPSQRFTISTLTLASVGSVSQGMSAPPSSTWLMKPKLWFIIPDQTSAPRNAGKAQGRIARVRYALRPRMRASLKTIARKSPRKKVDATETDANTKVHAVT